MSTVNVQPTTSARAAGNYALYGAGTRRAERHLEALEGHPWKGCYRQAYDGGVFYALGFGPLLSWVWSSFVRQARGGVKR